MPYISIQEEVWVDLSDFETDELVEELNKRNDQYAPSSDSGDLITQIYEKRRLGKDYQTELDNLIYVTLGRIV